MVKIVEDVTKREITIKSDDCCGLSEKDALNAAMMAVGDKWEVFYTDRIDCDTVTVSFVNQWEA